MSDLDPNHPLVRSYRAWKKWEAIHSSGRGQLIRNAGEAEKPTATGHSPGGLPEPASLAELQFWGEMRNAYEARFQDDLSRHLAEHPGTTQSSVMQHIESLVDAATDGSLEGSRRT